MCWNGSGRLRMRAIGGLLLKWRKRSLYLERWSICMYNDDTSCSRCCHFYLVGRSASKAWRPINRRVTNLPITCFFYGNIMFRVQFHLRVYSILACNHWSLPFIAARLDFHCLSSLIHQNLFQSIRECSVRRNYRSGPSKDTAEWPSVTPRLRTCIHSVSMFS